MTARRTWAGMTLDRPRIMGILNVTPDSFSDGGAWADEPDAVATGLRLAAEGADIIDVGGESTRPGAPAVPPEREQARVIPVIRALAGRGVRVSVDTRNAATMRAALEAGATIVNDVSGFSYDPDAARVVARAHCPVVVMHMRGTPDDMASRAVYVDPVAEVTEELAERVAALRRAGVAAEAIAIDPGIGFAKKGEHSVAVLRGLAAFTALGYPVLVGLSRKSFIGTISGEADPKRRLGGSVAGALYAATKGAAILRVHDVAETVQALRVWTALAG